MPTRKDKAAEAADGTVATFRMLLRTCGLVGRVMHPYFAQHGISGSQWGLLQALRRAEREGLAGLRLTDLSQRMLIRPPSVTGAVDRLERMGLVSRDPSANDARAKQVRLTTAGKELVERLLSGHGQRVAAVLSGLSVSEQGELHRLLDRLSEHLRKMAAECDNGEFREDL